VTRERDVRIDGDEPTEYLSKKLRLAASQFSIPQRLMSFRAEAGMEERRESRQQGEEKKGDFLWFGSWAGDIST